jgi:spore coat polysaccharide biosynthesis protein SpsF (cytidylyltransferase family)
MAQAVYGELYKEGRVFLMEEILELLERRPELATLNAEVPRSAMYANVSKE